MTEPHEPHLDLETCADLLKALAHPVRLRMVLALEKGERCACELTDLSPCDRTTSSKHLAVLREAGIVEDRREGTRILYSLKLSCVLSMLRCVNRFADPASDPGECACSLPKEEPKRRKES